jgi:hypothetical protein
VHGHGVHRFLGPLVEVLKHRLDRPKQRHTAVERNSDSTMGTHVRFARRVPKEDLYEHALWR